MVYGLAEVTEKLVPRRHIPMAFRHVMVWGGLRGAISLALVLTMTDEVFGEETVTTVRVMTFGVVLFTLLIQGTTITGLMRRLGLSGKAENELEQQRFQARIAMRRAGQSEVSRLGSEGVLFADMADRSAGPTSVIVARSRSSLGSHFRSHPELEAAMLLQARRDALVAERQACPTSSAPVWSRARWRPTCAIELNDRMAALDLLEERWEYDPTPSIDRARPSEGSRRRLEGTRVSESRLCLLGRYRSGRQHA